MLPSTQLGAQRFLDEMEDGSTSSSSDSSDSEEEDHRIKVQSESVRSPQRSQQATQQPVEVIVISSGEESSDLEEEEDEDEDEVGRVRSAACENGKRDDDRAECELLPNNNNNQISLQQPQHASEPSDYPAVGIDGPLAAAIEEYSKSDHEEGDCPWDAFGVQIQELAEERPRLRMLGVDTMGLKEGTRRPVEARREEGRQKRQLHHAFEDGSHQRELSGGQNDEQRPRGKPQRMKEKVEITVAVEGVSEKLEVEVKSESSDDEEEHEVVSEVDQAEESESDSSGEADSEKYLMSCRQLEQSELDKSKAMLMAGQVSRVDQRSDTPLEQQRELQNKQEAQELPERTMAPEKRKTIARIQKSTIGTAVLEAGRAAQIRRGVQPKDRVIAGRVTKPRESIRPSKMDVQASVCKSELSGRQQLLNERSNANPRNDAGRLKQDKHLQQSNDKTKRAKNKAKQNKRYRLNRLIKKQKQAAAREGSSHPKEADQPRESNAKMKKAKKHRQKLLKETRKNGF